MGGIADSREGSQEREVVQRQQKANVIVMAMLTGYIMCLIPYFREADHPVPSSFIL